MTTEQILQFVGGGIFCTLCLFLLCFLVWVYRRRRHTHPEQHFRTLILFPWVQLVGAVGLCIALFSNATSSDTQAYQLALRDLFVLVPLVVFRFGLVVVAFFWSQLHHEFRNARFGRDFMPPFSRRTYILAMAVAVWILFCMGAVLVTFNASDLVVSVVLYLSFYPVFSAGVLIGFFRTFRMISGDLKVVVKGFSVQQSEYFTQVRRVCIVSVLVFILSALALILKEIFFQVFPDRDSAESVRHIVTVLTFALVDFSSSVYLCIALFRLALRGKNNPTLSHPSDTKNMKSSSPYRVSRAPSLSSILGTSNLYFEGSVEDGSS